MNSEFDGSFEASHKSADFSSDEDPFELFERWMADASAAEINDANAMSLATVDAHGMPNVRMVLLKDADAAGFVFYTNLGSAKASELDENASAALCFHWKSLRRQVRVRGHVSRVSDDEADAYFGSRAKNSKIGAWASKQSQKLESRYAFEKRIALYGAKYGVGDVPRPPFWSGFRLTPIEIEFWHDRPYRLHDRIVFRRDEEGRGWEKTRLYP